MALASFGTILSVILFFGPMFFPKALTWWRTARTPSARAPACALPRPSFYAILLLIASAVVCLVFTLETFAPENLFVLTSSRLQAPTEVLFNRLMAIRVPTEADLTLKSRFVNMESRLLYLRFGPDALAHCPFCNSDDPETYWIYMAPSALFPHLANLLALSLATSTTLVGPAAAKWRVLVAGAAFVGVLADQSAFGVYEHSFNKTATRLVDVDMFFWDMRVFRLFGLACLDLLVAVCVYLTSTNRLFAPVPGTSDKLEAANHRLAGVRSGLAALGVVKNTCIRDEEMRERSTVYWRTEGRIVDEVMAEREVVEGVRDAVQNGRLRMEDIEGDAQAYAEKVLLIPGAVREGVKA